MIDLVIGDPTISQNAIAAHFGYTPGWVSQVFNSDAFKNRLAERKEEIIDPVIRASIEEKLNALADTSIKVLLEKLQQTQNMNVAIRALDVTTRALGYGAKQAQVQVNTYIAHVPPRAVSVEEWSNTYKSPLAAPKVIEHMPADGTAAMISRTENGNLNK
jgi:DNA primase